MADFINNIFKYLIFTLVLCAPYCGVSQVPDARLVVTGNLLGSINSCDCPHAEPGGLPRLKTIFDSLRTIEPYPYIIDVGDVLGFDMKQEELELLAELMDDLNYDRVHYPGDMWREILKVHNQSTSSFMRYTELDTLRIRIAPYKHFERGEFIEILARNLLGDQSIGDFVNKDLQNADILVIGGGGYVSAEVKSVENGLIVTPGLGGGSVMVLDLFMNDAGHMVDYQWETLETGRFQPDEDFHLKIESVLGSTE